jgi:glycosyltransferase involved in cell wall biosynthesis
VARNVGARRSTGEWLAFLDDDLWEPNELERQLARVAREPQLAMIHTDHRALIEGSLRPAPGPCRATWCPRACVEEARHSPVDWRAPTITTP